MTRNEAICLLQEVLEYQTSRGQRIVWFTDANVKSFIKVLKHSDSECENCTMAIEDRQIIVKCKDCKWRGHENDSPKWIPCLAIRTNNDWFCADGEKK